MNSRRYDFALGVLSALVLIAGIVPFVRARWEKTAAAQQAVIELAQKNSQACVDMLTSGTILIEAQESDRVKPLELFGFEITPGGSLPGGGKQKSPVRRWYIPARVTPVAYGDTSDLSYFYFDKQTRRVEGPFLPGRASQ